MLIAALFTGAKIWKQPQCPSTGEWIKKIWYALNIYSGIKFIQQKDMLLFVTTWLDLEGIMLSEKSLREKDKCCMIITYMQNLKNRVGECVKGDQLWRDELKDINLQLEDRFWKSNVQHGDYSQQWCIIKSELLRDQILMFSALKR